MRRNGLTAVLLLALIAAVPAQADNAGADQLIQAVERPPLSEVQQPQIDDPISEAELEDLEALASQLGLSLEATIARYAWNDNFALTVSKIREACPDAFAGAEIVDAGRVWVGFAGSVPEGAPDIIDRFTSSHGSVAVEVRADIGFTELEIEAAIATVHYAVFERAEVRDAYTSFDFETGEIETVVVLESGVADSILDDLLAGAIADLIDADAAGILDSITVSVVRSSLPRLGGTDSNTEHLGGESLGGQCTSGFVVKTPAGVRGISTAGHCPDPLTDDGAALTFQAEHQGTHGDFQWHTGPQPRPDDFYAGNASTTEVNRRDVAAVGAPVVGQSLCTNGITNYRTCQEVRKLNVCYGGRCSLVQMGARLRASGDSGGPVYWNYAAYGLHQSFMWDPFWPYDRDLFSRADRLPNALGVSVATN